jgi:hypothetical protein
VYPPYTDGAGTGANSGAFLLMVFPFRSHQSYLVCNKISQLIGRDYRIQFGKMQVPQNSGTVRPPGKLNELGREKAQI